MFLFSASVFAIETGKSSITPQYQYFNDPILYIILIIALTLSAYMDFEAYKVGKSKRKPTVLGIAVGTLFTTAITLLAVFGYMDGFFSKSILYLIVFATGFIGQKIIFYAYDGFLVKSTKAVENSPQKIIDKAIQKIDDIGNSVQDYIGSEEDEGEGT